jgi:hypothetical protein
MIISIIGWLFIGVGASYVMGSITNWRWLIKYVIRQEYPPSNLKRIIIVLGGLILIGVGILSITGKIWDYVGSGIP